MKCGFPEGLGLTDPVHTSTYRVIYADTDTGGVVYYGAYFRFFEVGRTEYLRDILGVSYARLQGEGLIFPVHETYCRYKAPARYDDLLAIRTSLAGLSHVSMRFHYEVARVGEDRPLVQGFTSHASVDKSGRLASIPGDFLASLRKLVIRGIKSF